MLAIMALEKLKRKRDLVLFREIESPSLEED